MSKLSDEVGEAMNKFMSEAGAQHHTDVTEALEDKGHSITMSRGNMVSKLPHFDAHERYCHMRIINGLRRQIRVRGGQELWPDIVTALQDTRTDLVTEMLPVAMDALADGIMMGRPATGVVRHLHDTLEGDAIVRMFGDAQFRDEADAHVAPMYFDEDMVSTCRMFINNTGYMHAALANVRLLEFPPDKVYNIWGQAMRSITVGMYAAGFGLGRTWSEQEILDGIAAASKEE